MKIAVKRFSEYYDARLSDQESVAIIKQIWIGGSKVMSKYTIATRILPDGREAYISRLTGGRARIYVCAKDDTFSIENSY